MFREVTKDEVEKELKEMKRGNAAGDGATTTDLLKNCGDSVFGMPQNYCQNPSEH